MKTGLVMEGGALRTVYSAGVCDALLDGNVDTDYFVGVSAGIAYGVSFLSKQRGRNLELLKRYAADRRYMGMGNLLNPKNRSYFGLEFAFQRIPNELVPFDHDAFEDWPGQVEAVVTNIETGKAEYMEVGRRDKVNTLMMASCAMPLLFPIFHIDGKPYLDGGAADAIPYERAFAQGCDRVMVVLTKPRDYVRKPEGLMPLIRRTYKNYPNFCETMERRAEDYNQSRERLFELERQGKVLVIAPESTLGVSRIERDTKKLELLWGQGYQMAADRMDEIREFFGQQ